MRSVFVAVAILAGPHQTATDFDFGLRFGVCTFDTVDSKQGTYVHQIGLDLATSIRLTIPTTAKQTIFEAIRDARFFDYPSTFQDKVAAASMVEPSTSYRLDVRTSDKRHTVIWQDSVRPSSADADRLRAMFKTIIDLIKALPEVKALPPPNVICL